MQSNTKSTPQPTTKVQMFVHNDYLPYLVNQVDFTKIKEVGSSTEIEFEPTPFACYALLGAGVQYGIHTAFETLHSKTA